MAYNARIIGSLFSGIVQRSAYTVYTSGEVYAANLKNDRIQLSLLLRVDSFQPFCDSVVSRNSVSRSDVKVSNPSPEAGIPFSCSKNGAGYSRPCGRNQLFSRCCCAALADRSQNIPVVSSKSVAFHGAPPIMPEMSMYSIFDRRSGRRCR